MAAADGEPGQQTGEQITMFGAKCPLGNCPKQGKWLGVKQVWYTERRARQSVYDHLTSTGAHSKLTTDECAAEAENVEVNQWQVELDDAGVQEDLEKNSCTLDELCAWQEDAVWFDDPERRAKAKRTIAEPSGAPRKKAKAKPEARGPSQVRSRARSRSRGRRRDRSPEQARDRDRRRSPEQALQTRSRGNRGSGSQQADTRRSGGSSRDIVARSDSAQLTNLGDRLEDQIQEQTRNAYIFVQVVFNVNISGLLMMNFTASRVSPNGPS